MKRASTPNNSCRSKHFAQAELPSKDIELNSVHRLLVERKSAISRFSKKGSYSDALQVYHFWAEKLCVAVIDYAYAANPAIVARVLNLPRELRDTIYLYLWEPDAQSDPNRDLLYWWEHFDEPWMLQGVDLCNSACSANMTNLRPPHFVDQAFVSQKFATEVLKRFKDSIGKDLRPLANQKSPVREFHMLDASVEAFVQKDVLGVGKTMEELVRNLNLRIDFQCDALEDDDAVDDGSPPTATNEVERRKYLAELHEGVAALVAIPYNERTVIHDGHSKRLQTLPRTVTLVIRQESAINTQDSLMPILNLVRRAYKGLRGKGFTVKIQYHSDEIGLKVVFEDDAWAWTDDDWRVNSRDKNISKVEPEDRNQEKLAEVWGCLRKVLFTTKPNDD